VELARLGNDLPSVVERAAHPSSGWTAIDLSAAAMLHTDACLRLLKSGNQPGALIQLNAAMTLLDAASARAPERADFARRWHIVVGGLAHAYGAPKWASDLQIRAKTLFPDSVSGTKARAAFETGLAAEIQAAAAGPISGPLPNRQMGAVPPEAVSGLRAAAREYETALSLDPRLAEAALHLGRLRMIDDRDGDATRWLRVAAAANRPPVRYLALLFLGAIAERQGHFTDAEVQYRAALDTFRRGQSAAFALSQLLARTGREWEARGTLSAHFTDLRGRAAVDPLWSYLADPSAHLGPGLDELRAEVAR